MISTEAVLEDLVRESAVVIVESSPHLAMVRCEACDQLLQPGRSVCFRCLSTKLRTELVNSTGSLYAFTRVHISAQRDVPYTIGYVDLDAGVRVLGQLRDFGAAVIDQRVALTADHRGGWAFAAVSGETS